MYEQFRAKNSSYKAMDAGVGSATAEAILERLKEIQYPNVGQFESLKSVLSPGKLRYQLLEWLLNKYDDTLLEKSTFGSEESDTARALRLATLASQLGLCPSNDMHTIQGLQKGDNIEPHIEFLARLIDFVTLPAQLESEDADIESCYMKDMTLMNGTIAQKAKAIFATEIDLLPGDMRFEASESLPSLAELQEKQRSMSATLEELTLKLHRIQDKLPAAQVGSQQAGGEPNFNLMQEKLLSFQQQCAAFNKVYNTEIKNWIRDTREDIPRTALGEKVARLPELQENMGMMLDHLRAIKGSYESILSSDVEGFARAGEENIFLREEFVNELEAGAAILNSTLERLAIHQN